MKILYTTLLNSTLRAVALIWDKHLKKQTLKGLNIPLITKDNKYSEKCGCELNNCINQLFHPCAIFAYSFKKNTFYMLDMYIIYMIYMIFSWYLSFGGTSEKKHLVLLDPWNLLFPTLTPTRKGQVYKTNLGTWLSLPPNLSAILIMLFWDHVLDILALRQCKKYYFLQCYTKC